MIVLYFYLMFVQRLHLEVKANGCKMLMNKGVVRSLSLSPLGMFVRIHL